MKKLKNSKGFTLMEMLIVVAIIAILIAIAIPTFTGQLEKAREAADLANIRSAYSVAMAEYLTHTESGTVTVDSQPMTQKIAGFGTDTNWPDYLGTKPDNVKTGGYVTVTVTDEGKASCEYKTGTPTKPGEASFTATNAG